MPQLLEAGTTRVYFRHQEDKAMPRGVMSEEKIQRWIKEGRGSGAGPTYKPWLTTDDIPATSRRTRVPSAKFGRVIHVLSDIEHRVFLLAEYFPSVVEAKEQWPIDRELTQRVARKLGIRHPCYPYTHIPAVVTVDLLLTIQRGGVLKTVGIDSKPRTALNKGEVLAKLQLTKASLAELGYDHLIVSESQLNRTVTNNLIWIRQAHSVEKEVTPSPTFYEEAADRLYQHLLSKRFSASSLSRVCQEFEEHAGWAPGTALRAARILLEAHRLHVDLRLPNIPDRALREFSFGVDEGSSRQVAAL